MLEIRPVSAADLPAIAALQANIPEIARWNIQDYLNFSTWVAVVNGQLAGFLAMRSVLPVEHELLNLAVAPEMRRRGIGGTLLEFVKRQAPGLWFLEVRESNHAARTFYKSHGFSDSGIRKGYYQNPYEDAIVMRN